MHLKSLAIISLIRRLSFAFIFLSLTGLGFSAQSKTETVSQDQSSLNIENISFEAPELIAKPFKGGHALGSISTNRNGQARMYTTTSGAYAVFNVIDLEQKRVLKSFPLPEGSAAWAHHEAANGDIYIGTHVLYRYQPDTEQLELVAKIPSSKGIFDITEDDTGMIYCSSWPTGLLWSYDPETGTLGEMGSISPNDTYLRGLAVSGNTLYVGTGFQEPKIVAIDLDNGTRRDLHMPEEIQAKIVYALNEASGLLFATVIQKEDENGNKRISILVIDAKTLQPVATFPESTYIQVAIDNSEENVYFMTEGKIRQFNVAEKKLVGASWPTYYTPRDTGVVEIGDDSFLSTITYGRVPFLFSLKEGKPIPMGDLKAETPTVAITRMGPARDRSQILLGAHMGTQGARYDTNTQEWTYFKLGQPESFASYEDRFFAGVYPKGSIEEYANPQSGEISLTNSAIIGEKQQRPYVMHVFGSKLVFGSIPYYGQLGGALSTYDLETRSLAVSRNIAPEQSITGLAYNGSQYFASTSISGGLGIEPTAKSASLLIIDPETMEVTQSSELILPAEIPQPVKMIGDLLYVGQDSLLAACGGYVLKFDTQSLEVTDWVDLTGIKKWHPGHLWKPVPLMQASSGLVYTVSAERCFLLDPQTMEFKEITPDGYRLNNIQLDDKGNLYFSDADSFYVMQRK